MNEEHHEGCDAVFSELLEDEMTHEEFLLMKAWGMIKRGDTKEDACQKVGISVQFFNDNVVKVMGREPIL